MAPTEGSLTSPNSEELRSTFHWRKFPNQNQSLSLRSVLNIGANASLVKSCFCKQEATWSFISLCVISHGAHIKVFYIGPCIAAKVNNCVISLWVLLWTRCPGWIIVLSCDVCRRQEHCRPFAWSRAYVIIKYHMTIIYE